MSDPTTSPVPVGGAHSEVPPRARIIDRGYRRYTGPRTNVRGAMVTIWRQSVQRALGLRRSVWAKVLPIASVGISYIPAIVFVGMVSLLPDVDVDEIELPSYGNYFPFIQAAIVLFIAFVGPEILCTDRRTGMLGIYLASPLTRTTYLLAKAAATASVLALVTVGPPLLMLVANVVQGVGPDGPAGVAGTLARIVGAGVVLAVLYTAVALGVSSLTARKAFATAALLMVLVIPPLFISILVETTTLPDGLEALSLITGPFSLVQLVHGEAVEVPGMNLANVLAGAGFWTGLGALTCWARYRSLQVTR